MRSDVNLYSVNVYNSKETTNKDNIVVEMKAEKMQKTEKSVLLKGVNGNGKAPDNEVDGETVGTQ